MSTGEAPAVTVLSVPGCPNAQLLRERLDRVLASRAEVAVAHRIVEDDAEARRWGMRGSPTLLVDGRDPFAREGQPFGLACRLYAHADGGVEGAPALAELAAAFGREEPANTA
ncbi:thioredoxin family protein [Salinifilum ghardaiensis]